MTFLIKAVKFCLFDNEIAKIRKAKRDEIFNGAIPVFVGSICNRVVDAFVVACVEDLSSEIVMRLLYALCGAHVFTYFVVLKTSADSPNFEYNFSVASEIASFAWSSIITLVVVNWLYSTKSIVAALLSWFFIFGFIAIVISLSNYFREVYFPMTEHQKDCILGFESETFSLALAYSLSIMIAVIFYKNASTNYVAGTDDLNSINDDSVTVASAENWWFFLYSIFITGVLLYSPYINQYFRNCRDKKEDNDDALSSDNVVDPNAMNTLSTNLLDTETKPSLFHRVKEYFFGWDKERNTCQRSLLALVEIGFAYMIASAWNLWATLSLQNFFPFEGGMVVAQLIFFVAMISTVMFVSANLYLMQATSTEEIEDAESEPWQKFGGLFYKSSSFSFGWALQTLITVIVAAIIPGKGKTGQPPWVMFAVLSILATAAFFGGRSLYIKYVHSSRRDEDSNSATNSEGSSPVSETLTTNITECLV